MSKIKTVFILSTFLFLGSFLSAEQNILVFLGPPGAGKGTICSKLSSTSHLPHISTGDLLREQLKSEDPLSNELRSYMSQGQLVPDEVILKVLMKRVQKDDCSKGFILDGFPRTKSQAEKLVAAFPQKDHLIFVNVSISDDAILERLQGRLICQNCSRPYHITLNPPLSKGKCNHCKGKLITREDDQSDIILKRLDIYKAQYAPIKKFLKENYQWIEIKNDSLDECFLSLTEKVNQIDPTFLEIKD